MKYIILIADGMEDHAYEELKGKTPLEIAKTPNMDVLAQGGKLGMVATVPKGFEPASDVANLSIMGYDPQKYYVGRAPLEAANMGIELKEGEVAFRCNLVTVSEGKLEDYSAGHIPNKEADILIQELDTKLGGEGIRFYPGLTYRHLMVMKAHTKKVPVSCEELVQIHCHPAHNVTGCMVKDFLPQGKGSELLIELMNASYSMLGEHEINKVRVDLKENPANMIWLWGQGQKPVMPSFYQKYKLHGAIISAVNLINGIGKTIGLEVVKVPGATGYYDTNYQGKAEYGMDALKKKDFVYIHVEAPDEAGHNGDLRAKITAIENFDKFVVGKVIERCKEIPEYRILIMADHKTPVSLRTHTSDPVGFILYGTGISQEGNTQFCEKATEASALRLSQGSELMDLLIS